MGCLTDLVCWFALVDLGVLLMGLGLGLVGVGFGCVFCFFC